MKYRDSFLFELWEYIELNNVKPSAEERDILKIIEESETRLLTLLGNDEQILFERFCDSLSELNLLSQKLAFAKGIKTATKYLLEALED